MARNPGPACLLSALVLLSVGRLAAAPPALDEVIDSVMYTDPAIPRARVVKVFSPRLIPLWLQALERPEKDLKCQAAAAIVLGQRRGMPGLKETVAPLRRALDQPDQHPTVRLAAAQALIALGARESAPSLFKHAQTDGVEMRNLVEPALARWDHEPARAVWLGRVSKPGLPRRDKLLAIQGLGLVREPKAVPGLRDLAAFPRRGSHPPPGGGPRPGDYSNRGARERRGAPGRRGGEAGGGCPPGRGVHASEASR
ncbi:MAG: HEAT repeat domain-containing protein [Gemmataceae bacterium]